MYEKNQKELLMNGQEKSGGCGCSSCLMGCLFIFVLFFSGIFAFSYYAVKNQGVIFDAGLKYSYPYLRPYINEVIEKNFPKQKTEIVQRLDRDVDDYLSLPENQRKLVRQQIFILFKEDAGGSQADQIIKIQEIEAFIQEKKSNFIE